MREFGHIRFYEDLIALLRARLDELDITFLTLDELANFSAGLSAQLLAPHCARSMGRRSLAAVLGALGIVLVAVEDAEALSRVLPRLQKRKPNEAHRQPVAP
jgi:hypothetical protein